MSERELTQYTIYYDAVEAPGRYIVRKWHIVPGVPEPMIGVAEVVDSLEAARELVPAHLFCIPRAPDDNVAIVETWT